MSVSGVDEVIANLRKVGADVDKAISNAIAATAFEVQNKAIFSINQEPSIGRKYGNHIASKAGDSPNTDTGRLAGSILTRIEFSEAWVYTDLDYGAYLEFGTTHIDARPWLEPALKGHEEFYFQVLKNQAGMAIR